ncbi:SWIM zinc finger domain-containing protein [Butyrivibrio sp. JL13D10]|uniref:SWIM zinc finger family protein n=1 Tax=Butyrivibrio sp. JL13D10 TaxID=3236815 RepID=UPI0038B4E801
MGLIEIASGNSVWRGMDYYNSKKVEEVEKTSDTTIDGTVRGENLYRVHVDIAHPRKSSCTCPFADGRRVICKHMIALYFTAYPKAAEDFLKQVEEWEKEEEEEENRHYEELRDYVNSLSKSELQSLYLDALIELEERRNRYW